MNFQLNGRAVWLYRPVKASRVAESWAVLAKSLGETTFFCTMEKKISINRLSGMESGVVSCLGVSCEPLQVGLDAGDDA